MNAICPHEIESTCLAGMGHNECFVIYIVSVFNHPISDKVYNKKSLICLTITVGSVYIPHFSSDKQVPHPITRS